MKKKGFTLAELTLSLGIIGVVAAITLPTLLQNTQNAQIGPKLAKASSMFQQAAGAMLNAKGVEKISDTGLEPDDLLEEISNHLKIVKSSADTITGAGSGCFSPLPTFSTAYLSSDGVKYYISSAYRTYTNTDAPPHKQNVSDILVDINGANKPNIYGTDVFLFALFEDGSLRPAGGSYWIGSSGGCKWTTYCKKDFVPSDPIACAGHIFENNFKVLYK